MADVGDFYTNAYLKTHMQRYQMALQMAEMQAQQQVVVAQMLAKQLAALEKQIADVKGVSTGKDFNALVKAYQLKQAVVSDKSKRQIQIYNQVNDIWDISGALPTLSGAGEKFANSLATAGSVENKARRFAGTVGGYSRSTDQAKAVAAAMYSEFKADSYRKGQQTTFDANDAKIRKAIADVAGVQPSDIDTADVQKEKMIRDRLKQQGGQVIGSKELDALIKEADAARTGGVSPADRKAVIDDLITRRTALEERQLQAIEAASLSPEQKIQQARQIYRSQLAPVPVQQQEAFQNYMRTLSNPQQLIMLGFENTTEGQAKFMFQKRDKIKDEKKRAAYDLYYQAQKERRAGKVPSFRLHEKVAELYPNNIQAQQDILGYIFRATAMETDQSIEQTMKRNAQIDEVAAKKYNDAIKKYERRFSGKRNVGEQIGDFVMEDIFRQRVKLPEEKPEFQPSFTKGGAADPTLNPLPGDPPQKDPPKPPKEDPPKPDPKEETDPAPKPTEVKEETEPTSTLLINPSWYDQGATVNAGADGSYIIVSPRYGNFTLDASGNVVAGKIKRGTAAGHFSDIQKKNPRK